MSHLSKRLEKLRPRRISSINLATTKVMGSQRLLHVLNTSLFVHLIFSKTPPLGYLKMGAMILASSILNMGTRYRNGSKD
jgi:hypothetical protein